MRKLLLLLPIVAASVIVNANCSNPTSVVTDSTAVDSVASVPDSVVLVFAGDAMQHQRQLDAARRQRGVYDYSGYFTAIEPFVNSADYAVVNLETTLGASGFTGYPMFCSPDSYASELKRAGFDMFLTANNHCLDRHDNGAIRTLNVLDALDVDHIGTYRNRAERDSVLPFIVEINGMKIAMLVYTYGTNGIDIQRDIVVDRINRQRIADDIIAARNAGAEAVCVNVHWGEEYKLLPNSWQRSLADYLVNQGADLVIGGHPHVVQPAELRTKPDGSSALVVYSMGNLISAMRTTDTRGGLLIKAVLRRDSTGRPQVTRAEYLPVFVAVPDATSTNYRLVIADSTDAPNAKAFLRNAYRELNAHNRDVPRSSSY